MAGAAQINAGAWDRRRLFAVLAAGVVAVLLFVTGLVFAIFYAVSSAGDPGSTATAATPDPGSSAVNAAGGTAGQGQARRDEIAARPMLRVAPDAARGGTPAAVAGPTIQIPAATTAGPVQVPSGFPPTPEGAIGQLAAIETTVLQGMSIPQANSVYGRWVMPGGVGVADWQMTKNVQHFLGSAGQGQSKDPTIAVTVVPVAAQIKGVDGQDWVLACVLLDVRAVITTDARIGYGSCERMQWSDRRWMIAPGTAASPAPSTWPGTALSFKAGWRTWADADAKD